MVEKKRVLSLEFYKKSAFKGSDGEKRYMIAAIKEEDENGKKKNVGLRATIWPGPFSFECTSDDLKTTADFDFSDQGIEDAVNWINENEC